MPRKCGRGGGWIDAFKKSPTWKIGRVGPALAPQYSTGDLPPMGGDWISNERATTGGGARRGKRYGGYSFGDFASDALGVLKQSKLGSILATSKLGPLAGIVASNLGFGMRRGRSMKRPRKGTR